MLDVAAEVVRLIYDVWPSYGGAIVLVSLMVGILSSPLTVRHARSTRTIAGLQGQIERIDRAHASDPVARNTAVRTLYRSHGVSRGTEWLWVTPLVASAYVLSSLVRGFTTLDPGNGGGPRYVEQGTALWQSLRDSGGQLSWFGVDLGTSAFAQRAAGIDALPYLMLPLALGIVTAMILRTLAGGPARGWARTSLFMSAIALFLSGAGVLYLVTVYAFSTRVISLATRQRRPRSPGRRPQKEFRAQCREAERLDAAGHRDQAAALRLDAVTALMRTSSVTQLVRQAHEVQRNLVAATTERPSGALAALDRLVRKCPDCVSPALTSSMLGAWARSPHVTRFSEDWKTIQGLLERKRQDRFAVLLDACRNAAYNELSEVFRRSVIRHLRAFLNSTTQLSSRPRGEAPDFDSPAWQLLDLVGPRNLSRADQLCALGDVALARDSLREALARYKAAVQLGSAQAAQRLAYHRAREGHRLLVAGKIAAAQREFYEARSLHKDPEYALLDAIARLLNGGADSSIGRSQLEVLDRTSPPATNVAFWRAIAHLQRGERDQAVALLRRRNDPRDASGQPWGPAEEGATLLAALEGNDHALVDCARRLVRTQREGWLEAGPSDPWSMVAAVARHDRGLLAEMVALVPDPDELPLWARVAGAHALLAQSSELARRGLVGEATGDVKTAERLLRT